MNKSILIGACAGVLVMAQGAWAVPSLGFAPVVGGLTQPVGVGAPVGDGRLFVTERSGKVRLIKDGQLQAAPFLDISALVDSGEERGMFGLAFAPDYASSGQFYVSYTNRDTGSLVVARYSAGAGADVANAAGEVLFDAGGGRANIHIGGWIGFRPGEPSNLYVTTGENNNPGNSQFLGNNLGKALRLDVSGVGPARPAPGNPFLGTTVETGDDFIWSYGLRHPFSASFDRANGTFFVGDVGNATTEEINIEPAGAAGGRNYGWPSFEGQSNQAGFTSPQFSYAHNPVTGLGVKLSPTYDSASVTTGFVYRGSEISGLEGTFLFGDFSSGRFATFQYDPATEGVLGFLEISKALNPGGSQFGMFSLVAFGEGGTGEIFALNYSTGALVKLVGTAGVAGDYNGDGTVDAADYTVWADHFGQSGSGWVAGDGNRDGRVDAADYTVWADNFGRSTPTGGAIPEPGSAAMLGFATLGILRRNRHR